MDTVDLLMHPVRLRVLHAMAGERTFTTTQLCARLPDVPKATLYRHVGLLAEHGVLEVVGEQRVRGAVERSYRLSPRRPTIDADAAASMSLDEHRRMFAAAMAVLLAEFDAYLDRDGADPIADAVGYRQGTVWLGPEELAEMLDEMRRVLVPRLGRGPGGDRRAYLISTILFPADRGESGGSSVSADSGDGAA